MDHTPPDDDVLTEDALWAKASDKMAVAIAMQEDRDHCREAWYAAGSAVEFALKARIVRRERLNQFPSREARPELYVHDLPQLMKHACIDVLLLQGTVRAAFRTAMDWDRRHDYQAGKMKRKVARSMVGAVCGQGGVLEWLKQC